MKKLRIETTSASLHMMAMAFMLCDHLWGTVVPGNDWMTCIGRIAFPIFAFLIVEGYFHTVSLKKYVGRMMLFALLSEIPFNLMKSGNWIDPFEQNVLWTFLIGIFLIWINEKAGSTEKNWVRILTGAGTLILGFILGLFSFSDYGFAGVFTVLIFYYTRGRGWFNLLAQILLLYYVNVEILSGFTYEWRVWGHQVYLVRQGLALLALIPIWLYRGKQGLHSRNFQIFCYSFYPVHMLILGVLQKL